MTSKTKAITIFVILALGLLVYLNRDMKIISPTQQNTNTALMNASFEWETGPSEAVNADGQPKTSVYLKATYANGVVERKLIDVESGCGPLPVANKDGAIFQCYAAGAGKTYRVMKGEGVYLVQSKKFEEGEPNVAPKEFEFETIAEFTPTK